MNIPAKKHVTIIGLLGLSFFVVGLVLLTFSLIKSERSSRIDPGVSTTARVISIAEGTCTRGRWSSKCYDISILFTDHNGNTVTTVLEKEYDRPAAALVPIIYNRNRPEDAEWNIAAARTWAPPGRMVAYLMMFGGAVSYLYALLMMRRLRNSQDGAPQ